MTEGQAVDHGPQVNHVAFLGAGGVEALEDIRVQMDAEALAPPIAAVQRTGATALRTTAFEAQEQAEMIENACERRCFVTGACHCFPVRWRRWTAAGGSTRTANRWSTRLTRPSFVSRAITLLAVASGFALPLRAAGQLNKEEAPAMVRTARSGRWSAPATWAGGQLPAAGARVQIRTGHTVAYDLKSDQVIRSIHVAGTLTFTRDRDTRLDVGLIKIQAGNDASEHGFDCDAHTVKPEPGTPRPALEVGTADQPIPAKHTALIRLTFVNGLDRQSCPAIVCCGGRMDFHGAPQSRTWVKLGATAKKGDKVVALMEPVTGWKVGDRIIVTATADQY